MKKKIDGFKVVIGERVLDEFSYYIDSNNHASISNNCGCLFDGYKLEAEERWNQIRKDAKTQRYLRTWDSQLLEVCHEEVQSKRGERY